MYTKEDLKDNLKKSVLEVKFTKTDGTERNMKCTLQPEFLPEADIQKIREGTMRPTADNIVAVWDIEKEGWRSFKVDSVLSVEEVTS